MRFRDGAVMIQIDMRNDALLRTGVAKMSGQLPRVDALDSNDACRAKIVIERLLRSPITRTPTRFLDDKPLRPDAARFGIVFGDAVIPDMRAGHCDDLTLIRGVGENLLIAGHGSIEDYLPYRLSLEPEGATLKDRPVR